MGLFRRSSATPPTVSAQDKENISWFWRVYLRPKVGKLFLLLLVVVSQGVVYQQFLSLTDRSLRVIFENGAMHDLIWICGMVFLVFFYRGITSFVVPRVSALIASDAVMKLRNDLIAHMMTLDLAYFERTTTGEFILRLVHQAEALSGFVGQTTIRAVRDISTVLIVSGYLFYQQPVLFSVAALVIPLLLLAMQIISRRIKKIQQAAEDAIAQYTDGIEEIVSGMRTIKISNQADVERARLNSETSKIKGINVRLQTAQALAHPFVDFAAAFVYMLVIGGGGYIVLSPDYNVDGASIITFLLGLVLVFDPGRRLAQFWAQVQSMLVVLDGVRTLHRVVPDITDAPNAVTEFDAGADLQLQGVGFGYTPDQTLFDNLSLTFQGGKTTAIVGTTGSGKTTLLSLLARLYDPTSGGISIGGTPIKTIKQTALRGAFSVVSQDIVVFNASIKDNIRYVRPDASDDDVREAARAAEILDLMDRRGDAHVGPKGAHNGCCL